MKGHLAETWWATPVNERLLQTGSWDMRNQGQHPWTGVRWQGGGRGRQEQERTGRSGEPCTCEWGICGFILWGELGATAAFEKDLTGCWAPQFSGHFRRRRTDTTYARRNQGGGGKAMSIVSMRDHRWVGCSSCVRIPGQADEALSGDGCWNEWVFLYGIYVNSAIGRYRRKLISLSGKGGRNVKEVMSSILTLKNEPKMGNIRFSWLKW